jgi:small subunit ribosomal protein S16|tara:strand:- start:1807 stop:2226 length:420 start_codon:yes stop_codon:yes gene_type:complete
MPVRIRLAQRGKKKNRTFRVIVADSRSPRDGKFIEDLGYYDPHHNPSMVEIDVDKAVAWLDKGAQPSERAQKILEISGAWAQWRSSKGEVISIPQAPEEKIKSSSKANKKKLEENSDETSSEEATSEGSADEGTSKEEE